MKNLDDLCRNIFKKGNCQRFCDYLKSRGMSEYDPSKRDRYESILITLIESLELGTKWRNYRKLNNQDIE